ncbi:MAG: exodeoxyribonuclease V subunit gamma, partial [Bacteroidota bacterium]|nr:exodeoxyribonuclease V subunit gamma [Bacteroidota bacterium]
FGIDYEKGNPALFAVQERLIEQATGSGFTFIIPKERESALPSEIIEFKKALRHSLFNSSRSPQRVSARIFSHAAATMREEIRFVAKKIKELIATGEAPAELSKICVCTYRQDDYAPLAREIFREYGIPANITDRARLDRAPLYLAFNALFDIAEFNFNRRSVLRLLASPYLLISGSNGDRVDAANLYEVITEYRLRQGSASWVEEIDIHREDLAAQEKPVLDEFEIRELQEKAAKLDRARKDIGVIETLVQRLRGNKTPAEFHEAMLALIRDTEVLRQLLLSSGLLAKADALEFDTRSYRAFTELLEELLDICSKLGLEKTSLPLSFYTERIRIAALRTRFAPRAEPGRGVVITSFEQTIGYEFEHLFLLGMNDGIFPEIYSPSLFQLREHQSGEDEKLVEQRYLFYQTLSTFRNSAYVVWHSGSDDKKSEILRSQFADALEELTPFQEIPAATQEALVFSANEFFRYAAKDKHPEQSLALGIEHGLADDAIITLRDQIPHSVTVETKRRESAFSEYSGVFPFDELTDAEQRDLLSYRDRVYSISQLETYAACPFKFFSKYVLHLESGLQKEVEEGLSGAERGVVLHDTLYQILSNLRQSDRDLRSLSDEDFARVRDEVFARQQKNGNSERVHPFLRLDTESVFSPPEPGIGVLQKFIEAERKYASFITKPSFFEATFGIKAGEEKRDKLLYREEHVEIEGMKFRGKIDRIDMDSESGVFSVIDYKSGKSASSKDIERGISLQLPLYLRIAEDLLRAHLGDESMSGVAGIYHTLLSKESEQKLALGLHDFAGKAFEGHKKGKRLKAEVETAEALQEIIAATIGFAKQYVEGISGGSFPLVKEENISACTYCEYKLVCRVGEALEAGSLRK